MQKAFMCERNEIQRMKWEKAKEMDVSSFPFLMYDHTYQRPNPLSVHNAFRP